MSRFQCNAAGLCLETGGSLLEVGCCLTGYLLDEGRRRTSAVNCLNKGGFW